MSSRVDVFRIESGHSYSIAKGEKVTDMINYVQTRGEDGGGRTYVIVRDCIAAQIRPPRLQTWSEAFDYVFNPSGEAPRKWMIVAIGDDYLPLCSGPSVDTDERESIEGAILNSSVQRAIAGASRSDIVPRYTGISTMVIVGLIVALTLAIMLIGVQQYAFPGSRDVTPDRQQIEQIGAGEGDDVN